MTERVTEAAELTTEQLTIHSFVQAWAGSPFDSYTGSPWNITQIAAVQVQAAIQNLGSEFHRQGEAAIHRSAQIEAGAVLKGPAIVGPNCFIAATAYLRGGVYLERDCIIGPGCELKSSFVFGGSKLAHLNFVGDSVIGSQVNIEAGAIVANYRNERVDKLIRIAFEGAVLQTGVEKFGALIGDRVRVGANAVVAPGALLRPDEQIGRLVLLDQSPA